MDRIIFLLVIGLGIWLGHRILKAVRRKWKERLELRDPEMEEILWHPTLEDIKPSIKEEIDALEDGWGDPNDMDFPEPARDWGIDSKSDLNSKF